MIVSTALSIGGPTPAVADNTTAVVLRRSDSNLPATPDISRAAGVSSSALLPLSEETDILVDETHAVKRRRLSTTTGETIYIIQVTVSPAGSNMHWLIHV